MQTYRTTIKILSAFGTPLVGDTLFGQLCWTLSRTYGEERLNDLLKDYTEDKPFAVVSDAFPKGYLPLPDLPSKYWKESDTDRKELKKRVWITHDIIKTKPLNLWQESAKPDSEVQQQIRYTRTHNTINRQTGTTGTGMFAPYQTSETAYGKDAQLDIYILIDETRITGEEIKSAIDAIGKSGYGRDATIGLGKFEITGFQKHEWNLPAGKAFLTLAACAPQGLGFDSESSYYKVTTRFGRHGDIAALSGKPFKKPVLMAQTKAVFTMKTESDLKFIGQGIKGVSLSDERTVHQGYAPVIPIKYSEE